MIAAILNFFVQVFELAWDAADQAVTRWGWPRFIAGVLTIVFLPIFIFVIGPSRIGFGIGRGVRAVFTGLFGAGAWIVGTLVTITRSALAAVLFLIGGSIACAALLLFYPNFRSAFGPLLLIPVALVAALFLWRAGQTRWAMAVVGLGTTVYLALAFIFFGSVGQGMMLTAILSALIFFAAAREIRGTGARWATALLGITGLIFVCAVGAMLGATTLQIVSPGLHQRAVNFYDSLWIRSERADTAEKAENSVNGYYNHLLEEKRQEIEKLIADNAPEEVVNAANTELQALKLRAERANAEAKAKANPPAPAPPPTPASAPAPTATAPTSPAPAPIPPSAPPTPAPAPVVQAPPVPRPAVQYIQRTPTGTPTTLVEFDVESDKLFTVSWVTPIGREELRTPASGVNGWTQPSYEGHVWVIKDAGTGAVLKTVTATASTGKITF